MKKLLLSLGSVAAAVAPVAAVIACGDKTSKSDETVSKLGLTLGKQDAAGVVLDFPQPVGTVAAGTYYFAAADVAAGKEITVASTTAGETVTLKIKAGKALTAATANVGESLEGTGTSAATDYPTGTAAAAATTAAGNTANFTVTEGDITKAVDNNAGIIAAIKGALEAKTPEALFENTYLNKDALEKTINKVLADIDKKLPELAITTLTKPSITQISNLDTSAVDADEDVDTFGLTIGKQDATDGIVLTFTADTNQKIAAGSYYFTKEELKVGKTITVKSTDAGKTTNLKVKTAAIAAAAADVKANLETTTATPADVDETVVAALGDAANFTATEGDITKTLIGQPGVNTKIKDFLDAVIKTRYVSKEDLVKAIDQLLIASVRKLKADGTSLVYAGPTITINSSLVDVETEV